MSSTAKGKDQSNVQYTTEDKFYKEKVLYDQKFGIEVLPFQLKSAIVIAKAYADNEIDKKFPWHRFINMPKTVINKKEYDNFVAIHLDLHHFRDWEIDVDVDHFFCVVTAIHGPREDAQGTTLRKYERKIKMPDHVKPETIKAELSIDGILTVSGEDMGKIIQGDGALIKKSSSDLYGVPADKE